MQRNFAWFLVGLPGFVFEAVAVVVVDVISRFWCTLPLPQVLLLSCCDFLLSLSTSLLVGSNVTIFNLLLS